MLDREKVVAVLKRRFPGSALEQVAAAANAIVGMDDEWEDVSPPGINWTADSRGPCRDGCYLRRIAGGRAMLKVHRRKSAE
jgi:hypothetical protein